MADIKVKEGDRVIVYRNMPKLDDYPQEVRKGFKGTVKMIGGDKKIPCGKWALISWKGTEFQYVKLTYLKHA